MGCVDVALSRANESPLHCFLVLSKQLDENDPLLLGMHLCVPRALLNYSPAPKSEEIFSSSQTPSPTSILSSVQEWLQD